MIKSIFHKILIPAGISLCLVMAVGTSGATPVYQGPDVQIIGSQFYQELESEFQRYSYQIDALENGVPALILQKLPTDLNKIKSTKQRKTIFFTSLLPMILIANDEILVERNKMVEIQQQLMVQHQLNPAQQHIVATLAKRYKIKVHTDRPEKTIQQLLNRIDVIPADLALAQAANESAWGTSRFSQLANNLFGQWTFTPGQGIVPEDRPEGQTYEVRKFLTVYDSVRSYLHNLNTHSAYRQLRQLRAESRLAGQNPEGSRLAEGLLRYSIRGEAYVKELQAMIKTNHLDRFATAKLRAARQSLADTGSFALIQR